MVVFEHMTELVNDDVINNVMWCKDNAPVVRDVSLNRTGTPARLVAFYADSIWFNANNICPTLCLFG